MARPAYNSAAYRRRRDGWDRIIRSGQPVNCHRCGGPIAPGAAWDLDHEVAVIDGGAHGATFPSHRSCNRAHGAELAHTRSAKSRHAYGRRPGRSWPTGDIELDDPAQDTPTPPHIPFYVY